MASSIPEFCMADLFCGAGGTSTGAVEALAALGYDAKLTAINHWQIAVATHTANHPEARHLCASLDALNPRELFKPGELQLLWASPECTHHSIARGGKPINDQSRATAWCVTRWAEALLPPVILVENVPEFRTWGPIGSNGRPLKSKKGETFRAWLGTLESMGYKVDWKILCAADYGDPTTRKRLFVQAVRGRREICWPEPTHAENGAGGLPPWRAAAEIIDWELKGKSIFERERPLSEKTLRRIWTGFQKFGARPFVMPNEGPHRGNAPRSVESPLNTVTASRGAGKLVEPFLVNINHANSGKKNSANWNAHPVTKPLGSVTTSAEKALVEPFIIAMEHKGNLDSIRRPMRTITTARCGAMALCEPFLVHARGKSTAADVGKPAPTVTATGGGHLSLAQPFLVKLRNTNTASDILRPVPTVTAGGGHLALCQPALLPQQSDGRLRPVSEPSPTVAAAGAIGLVEPYLIKYYGNETGAESVRAPLDTVTTKERFGLVRPMIEVDGERYLVDFLFRMLQPHELAGAQGFRADYKFTGNKTETVRQIGNAVPRHLARALVLAAVGQQANIQTWTRAMEAA